MLRSWCDDWSRNCASDDMPDPDWLVDDAARLPEGTREIAAELDLGWAWREEGRGGASCLTREDGALPAAIFLEKASE